MLWYTVHSVVYTCDLILARIWLLSLCPFINRCYTNRGNNGILKRHSFFWDYILEKENTHIPSRLLDSSFLNWDYIPEQGKVLHIVQLLDITIRVLFSTYTTRACTQDAWISWSFKSTSAAAWSARSLDKVQTCYSHQGNNDTHILGEKFQE